MPPNRVRNRTIRRKVNEPVSLNDKVKEHDFSRDGGQIEKATAGSTTNEDSNDVQIKKISEPTSQKAHQDIEDNELVKNQIVPSHKNDEDGGLEDVTQKSQQLSLLNQQKPITGITPKQTEQYVCPICMRAFMSREQLDVHQLTHSIGVSSGLVNYDTQKLILEFIESWSNATTTANNKSRLSNAEVSALMMTVSPLMITWDSGLATSFKLVPIVNAPTVQDVISYTWFSSSYNLPTPFPQASVVRIVLHTNWASMIDNSRNLPLIIPPPTTSNVMLFRELLTTDITPSGCFNPRILRANAIMMSVKFVLDNLHLNANTSYTLDMSAALVPSLGSKYLRVIDSNNSDKWYSIMYPSRLKLPNLSKTSEFVNYCIDDRVGRYDKAQIFSGAMAEWADTFETCDSLTLYIRDRWLLRLEELNISPAELAQGLTRCAKNLVTITAPTAPSSMRMMPFKVTNMERQLHQIMLFMNIGNNADAIEPIISNAAQVLSRVSPLNINPKLVSDSISAIVESTTNSISPAAALLNRLRPQMSDFSDFRRACISILYNGLCTTYLDEASFPSQRGNVLDVNTLVDMFTCLNALLLTTDPNAPIKAFMTVANAMYGFENIHMDDPNWNQQMNAAAFNAPSLWPQCFIHRTIDRRQCPILYNWCNTIHEFWPRPSQTTFGAPDVFGSANLFTDPGVLLLPFQYTPASTVTPTLNLLNEMCNWRNAVIDLLLAIINDGRLTLSWNPAMRSSMANALVKFKIIKSYTPAYIAELLPLELSAIAPALPIQPFQVPFCGLNRDQIPVKMNISRQAPNIMSQPNLHISMTQQFIGVPIRVNARAITVALLSGLYLEGEPLITNVWYADALTPLYTNDSLFANAQQAVIASEAYQTSMVCIGQCANVNNIMDHPFDWLPEIEFGANEAASMAKTINNYFLEAFDLPDDSILIQPFLEGDPRASQITVSYEQYNGLVVKVTPEFKESMIADSTLMVGDVMRHEYNIFGLCRGDIIIGQYLTESGFNPLAPPAELIFSRDDDDVHIFSDRTVASFGMNGNEMTVEDADGNFIPLRGKWIMPLRLWQINHAFFSTILPNRIRSGHLFIRIELGAYPYTLQYFNGRDQMDGFSVFTQWMSMMSSMGMAPVPFLMPESMDHDVSSGLSIHYIWATEFNDGSLFCTNSASPYTIFGPDRSIPLERFSILTNDDIEIKSNQLPEKIDFYGLVRRHNFETPPLSAMVTTYGTGLPHYI
ncbi:core shell protein [Baboon orthoreovirus]|uniref:Core shell protein n=1 Tax=Baboon orthoreovirus TaxID=75888 RepID=G0YZM1_9REOV|nr:core shell protein [Baboon orthoreovirus]AEK86191.1 core shell protein [Baboon orthoreovirus]